MKDSALSPDRPWPATLSVYQRFARRAVFSVLKGIRGASLTLDEGGVRTRFGEAVNAAGIHAHIDVHDPQIYAKVLRGGDLGAGEAYMEGLWDSPDVVEVVRMFVANLALLESLSDSRRLWGANLLHLLRRNTRAGAKSNIAAHYDLGNDFFRLFLDDTMAYSSAIFADCPDDLEAASLRKFRHICERLQLSGNDHLLEIGTGWGGLAIYAARHYGCRVTTTTLSREQYDYARAWVEREQLTDRITLLRSDYRELDGRYDKLVSVEMIEAVGTQYYREYFEKCSALLKPEGLMLIQSITISDQRYAQSVGSADFIKRYIFPGGQLPCNSVIADNLARHTDMQLIGLEDITHDYALTLKHWRQRFWRNIERIRGLGAEEAFIRMWHYYFCFCEGGFRERAIHTAQFLIAKPHCRALPSIVPIGHVA